MTSDRVAFDIGGSSSFGLRAEMGREDAALRLLDVVAVGRTGGRVLTESLEAALPAMVGMVEAARRWEEMVGLSTPATALSLPPLPARPLRTLLLRSPKAERIVAVVVLTLTLALEAPAEGFIGFSSLAILSFLAFVV
jgi:hypothetical protein